jgi:hypothetical protein
LFPEPYNFYGLGYVTNLSLWLLSRSDVTTYIIRGKYDKRGRDKGVNCEINRKNEERGRKLKIKELIKWEGKRTKRCRKRILSITDGVKYNYWIARGRGSFGPEDKPLLWRGRGYCFQSKL